MLWGSLIQPWLNQRNEEPEVDEKKQKKLERKMKREQKFRWIDFLTKIYFTLFACFPFFLRKTLYTESS